MYTKCVQLKLKVQYGKMRNNDKGSQLYENIVRLKLLASDGKYHETGIYFFISQLFCLVIYLDVFLDNFGLLVYNLVIIEVI